MGFWVWSVKSDTTEPNQLDAQVAEFENVFRNVFDKLNYQPNCSSSWIDLHIIEEAENFPISFPISSKSLKILSSTGLFLDITFTN